MKISMSAVWDRTAEFLSDNIGAVAGIAALGLFVPFLVGQLLQPAFAAAAAGGARTGLTLVWLICALASFAGRLAVIALALAPGAGTGTAWRTAAVRFVPAAGLSLLLFAAAMLAFLPVSALLAADGVDLNAVAAGASPDVSPGTAGLILLYAVIALPLALWIAARLAPLWPVVVAERRGLRAVGRTFALTRGAAGRIVGVLLLFGIVASVAGLAAKTVVGSVARIAFGDRGGWDAATIVTAVAAALVSAAAWTVTAAFLAKLYAALRDRADVAAELEPAAA